ncbi:MAG: hypothetical protein J7L71_02025 [Spirochaetaceae bacterium]|nr:hypothetical protein [Spirochaetaceae bacterium]
MRKDECFIEIGGQSFKMEKEENRFSYTIKAPNNETPFNFKRGKIISKTFVLKVVPKTELTNITIRIKPPKYTGLKVKRIVNEGNIEIVEGTELRWKIKYDHATKNMLIFSNDSMINEGSHGDYEKRMYKSGMYQILAIGQLPYDTLKVNYSVNVLPDLYPEIVVSGIMDSTYEQTVYFKGWIRDDYGLSRLTVIIKSENGITLKQKEIEIEPDSRQQYFYWIDKINTYTGNVTVGFIVYDNDEIHGPKKTESKLFYYHIKNRNEIDKENMRRVEEIAKKVTDGNSKIQQIREKIEALRRNEITNELSNWEISERRKELMQIERELKEALNEIALKNEIKNKTEEKWLSEELRNKADEIQKLFKNLMDDELKDLLKQYEELLKEQDKSRENELLREMDMSLENLKEKMDMSLELLKRYDVEKELMNRADEMDQLRKQVERENTDKNTQPEIKKNLEEWNKKLDENIFKNNQLKEPYNLKNVEKQVNKLRKDIEKKRRENSTKEITKSMKEISNKLRQTVGMNGGGEFLDIEELRKQVHALVIVSLEHETILDAMNRINIKSPLYNQNMIREHEIEKKFNRIRDSLISYGYKQPIITKIIGKEMFHVETAFERLWRNYNEQIISRVRISQNEIMKGLNEVAVRLDEIVRSLEKAKGQASGSKGFTDSRRKKKGGDQLKNMTQQQQSLKEQLKSMIEQMKNNGNKKNGMNEQLAKMLAEREKMRRKIEQLYREGNYGKNVKEKLNQALKMMDEVEKDIIYKRLSKATVEKDEWINTRLLEAENAEKQQESENRRESKEFKGEFERSVIDSLTTNKVQKERIQELKYKSVRLKAYYQERYDKYLESLKKKK